MIENCKDKRQVYKFGLYGLLKNLRFFEPFLWVYFLQNELTLFHIGLLYSIREAIIYIFEIPSGVFADRFGKKNELILCFIFYIISFIGFYYAKNFALLVIPMIFYGFGEAFRSGTHKAMIMEFIDYNEINESKSRVYGLTRSYSNIGSFISSLLGVVFILYAPNISYLFLFAIIPYLLDLLLIISYPEYLNSREDVKFVFKDFILENIRSVKYSFTNIKLRKYIVQSSVYNAIFKTIKDYIQPIVLGLGISVYLFTNYSHDENIFVYIGLIYAVAQLVSVFIAKYAYKLETFFTSRVVLNICWLATSLTAIAIGFFIHNVVIVVLSFIMFYVFLNIRKPFMVEKLGDATANNKRASVLSIESQMTSLTIMVIAPILGLISDHYNIGIMMISLGLIMMLVRILRHK